MPHARELTVSSHVARDLLQSSGVFEHERQVVWEYVSNGLDYVEPGVKPVVMVYLDSREKTISVVDNGRGMSFADLGNFFTMHGENLDRKSRRAVRGFFGTGKSAAFGIANLLRVTTVQNGKKSVVELSREDVEAATSGDPIPVRVLEREVQTDASNGTIVDIEQINLKAIDQRSIIEYIERHLARWSKDATVFVNNHECEFREPPVRKELEFHPEGELRNALGDVHLRIKVAKVPLDESLQGVAIFSDGVWYETTLAGSERKEQANMIMGEVDVPRLTGQGSAPIPAFDLSRRMKLNRANPLVQAVHAFIGRHVEEVRKALVDEEREIKKSEEAQKLQREAARIAEIINRDFASFRERLRSAKAKIAGVVDPRQTVTAASGSATGLTYGGELDATLDRLSAGSEEGDKPSPQDGSGPREATKSRVGGTLVEQPDGDVKVAEREGKPKSSPLSGGFHVDFNNAGADAPRAPYESASRTIWINLDHPQLSAALASGGTEDVKFRRLAYEVALSEYSIGLVHELNEINWYFDIEDAIYDVRENLNRVSRAASGLYED